MLPRVLEPEAMDTPEEARAYDDMGHAEVNARFVADFLRAHGPCRGGEILDVGTGTARIPVALCRADPFARVVGLDLAEAMLERAREVVYGELLDDRIRLILGDAKALRPGDTAFEAVISNSIVHHVPDPAPVLGGMARLVDPGGTLFVRDLYRPDDRETVGRLVSRYADSEASEGRALFEASLNAALTLDEVRDMVRALGMPGEGVSMTSDRHWTWVWHRPS